MQELIKVTERKGQKLVDARELHSFLEVKSEFRNWIKNRISDYSFAENKDFVAFGKNLPNGGKSKEYALTLDMAKELSMVERTDKGREARQYFIAIEKKYTQLVEDPRYQIAEKLKTFIVEMGSANKAAAFMQGVSSATLSHMVNEKWAKISDDMWQRVELGIDKWKRVRYTMPETYKEVFEPLLLGNDLAHTKEKLMKVLLRTRDKEEKAVLLSLYNSLDEMERQM
jgi:phage anti-repressor protein